MNPVLDWLIPTTAALYLLWRMERFESITETLSRALLDHPEVKP